MIGCEALIIQLSLFSYVCGNVYMSRYVYDMFD